MRKLAIVLVAVLGLGLVACGGGDGGGDTTGPTGSATGATGATGATASGCEDLTSGAIFTLTISGFAFHPDCFTAKASQGITIVNEDSATHSFTISGSQVDVTIDAGQTFNGEPVTGVLEPGTYDFFCRSHPSMTGQITVE
jgi:plastocyanin